MLFKRVYPSRSTLNLQHYLFLSSIRTGSNVYCEMISSTNTRFTLSRRRSSRDEKKGATELTYYMYVANEVRFQRAFKPRNERAFVRSKIEAPVYIYIRAYVYAGVASAQKALDGLSLLTRAPWTREGRELATLGGGRPKLADCGRAKGRECRRGRSHPRRPRRRTLCDTSND